MIKRNRIRALAQISAKDRGLLTHALLAGMAVVTLVAVVGIAQAQAAPPTTSERYEKVRDAEKAQQGAKGQYKNEYGIEYDRNPLRDKGPDWDDGKHEKATGIENANQHRPDHARENYEAAKDKENKGHKAEEDDRGWFARFFGWGKDKD